jgi:hypothetical protein
MEILCKICNKKYASKNSLSNHIRLYHSNVGLPKVANGLPKVALSDIKEYKCNKCNKIYNNKNSKYRHQKNCNNVMKDLIAKIEPIIKLFSLDNYKKNIINTLEQL